MSTTQSESHDKLFYLINMRNLMVLLSSEGEFDILWTDYGDGLLGVLLLSSRRTNNKSTLVISTKQLPAEIQVLRIFHFWYQHVVVCFIALLFVFCTKKLVFRFIVRWLRVNEVYKTFQCHYDVTLQWCPATKNFETM